MKTAQVYIAVFLLKKVSDLEWKYMRYGNTGSLSRVSHLDTN